MFPQRSLEDHLIGNLCTLWVGQYHLHANAVRYERPSKPHQTSRFPHYNDHSPPGSYAAVVKDYKTKNNPFNSYPNTPALVLEETPFRLFAWTPCFLEYKEFDYVSDDESFHSANNKSGGLRQEGVDLVNDSDEEGVSETIFGDKTSSPRNSAHKSEDYVAVQQPEDS
ncbi:hypothetical protein Tco_0129964, partial [Tanacetum coccineum]